MNWTALVFFVFLAYQAGRLYEKIGTMSEPSAYTTSDVFMIPFIIFMFFMTGFVSAVEWYGRK